MNSVLLYLALASSIFCIADANSFGKPKIPSTGAFSCSLDDVVGCTSGYTALSGSNPAVDDRTGAVPAGSTTKSGCKDMVPTIDPNFPRGDAYTRFMYWATAPFHTDIYTLTSDAAYYVPGAANRVYLKVNKPFVNGIDMRFTGLMMYAEDSAGKKVGTFVPISSHFSTPHDSDTTSPCYGTLFHNSGRKKPLYNVFYFMAPPAGRGSIRIRALVKQGIANAGAFFYPNLSKNSAYAAFQPNVLQGVSDPVNYAAKGITDTSAYAKDGELVLSEAGATPRLAVTGVGQSCTEYCQSGSSPVACDETAMQSYAANVAGTVASKAVCALPILRDLSTAGPSTGNDANHFCYIGSASSTLCSVKSSSLHNGNRFCACVGGSAGGVTPQPPTATVPTATTTMNLCNNVNCLNGGTCIRGTGQCSCINGYSGATCATAPAVSCTVDCAGLNRATCSAANTCGQCLSGFSSTDATGNTLCSVTCTVDCAGLNRKKCTSVNTCGACLTGFSNPTSNSVKDACVSIMGPTTTPRPTTSTTTSCPYDPSVGCKADPSCCPSGKTCYVKDPGYSGCRTTGQCVPNTIYDAPPYATPWACTVQTTAPPNTGSTTTTTTQTTKPVPTTFPVAAGSVLASVTAQWASGFCGTVQAVCGADGTLKFNVPSSVTFNFGWNLVGMTQTGGVISGACPAWTSTKMFTAGFCASTNFLITSDKSGFIVNSTPRTAFTMVFANAPTTVSYTFNIQGVAKSSDVNSGSFVAAVKKTFNDMSNALPNSVEVTDISPVDSAGTYSVSLMIACPDETCVVRSTSTVITAVVGPNGSYNVDTTSVTAVPMNQPDEQQSSYVAISDNVTALPASSVIAIVGGVIAVLIVAALAGVAYSKLKSGARRSVARV